MSRALTIWLRRLLTLTVLGGLLLGVVMLVRRCGPPATEPELYAQLRITRRNLHLSNREDKARVLAEIRNAGPKLVPAVEVTARLLSRRGEERGARSVVLEHLAPDEKRVFSLVIDFHGKVKSVDFSFAPPK